MSDAMTVIVGDWVRFYADNGMHIGVVQYIQREKYYPYGHYAYTDIGRVDIKHILECRTTLKDTSDDPPSNVTWTR